MSGILSFAGPSHGTESVSSFVNTLLNSSRRISLFSAAEVTSDGPDFRGARPMLSFFRDLMYL